MKTHCFFSLRDCLLILLIPRRGPLDQFSLRCSASYDELCHDPSQYAFGSRGTQQSRCIIHCPLRKFHKLIVLSRVALGSYVKGVDWQSAWKYRSLVACVQTCDRFVSLARARGLVNRCARPFPFLFRGSEPPPFPFAQWCFPFFLVYAK